MTKSLRALAIALLVTPLVFTPALEAKGKGKGKGKQNTESENVEATEPAAPAPVHKFILRAHPKHVRDIAERNGLEIVRRMSEDLRAERNVYLVTAPEWESPERIIENIEALEPDADSIELAKKAKLPKTTQHDKLGVDHGSAAASIYDIEVANHGKSARGKKSRKLWRGYVEQPAALLTELKSGRSSHKRGAVVVAIIDSGIDEDHQLFDGRLLPGWDFTNNMAGASEFRGALDQSTVAILSQSTVAILSDETIFPLDQSTVAILSDEQAQSLRPEDLPAGFGHGTMVAGLIHLVAPEALLLPLKAFGADGSGNAFDIAEAIYFAADQGADVINMSFSLEEISDELVRAVNYAVAKGSICVAASGNDGKETIVYPAALGNTIGVAATDLADHLSLFSNYGQGLVAISAPGEQLVTAFPGGGWALSSGTSFAAPLISGAVALMMEKEGDESFPATIDLATVLDALSNAQPVESESGGAGAGRLDLDVAMDALQIPLEQ